MSTIPSPEFLALQAAVAGRYSLDHELGRGGMGVVFLARDVALDRHVAIKLLPAVLARLPDARRGFLREARTAAGLSHPHIVPIHAVEEQGEFVFFVMGYVDGETLGHRVRRTGALPPDQVMRMVQEVAWALGHAHAHGIVHRDVKPDNILLERDTGRALVTDFGIAQVLAESAASGPRLAGTPQYMAPEQAAGGAVDGRADLYALGVTAFFALTGRLPFEANTVAGLLVKHAEQPPPRVLAVAPRVAPRFAQAIERMLEKDPARRFARGEEIAEAVRAARGMVPDIPAPVRAFLRDADAAGGEIAFFGALGVGALGVLKLFFGDDLFAAYVFYPVSVLMIGLAGARLGQMFGRARDLIRQGYAHRHVRPAVALETRRRLDEEATPEARPGMTRDTLAAAAVGAIKTAACVWLAQADIPVWLNFAGAAGAVMIPAAAGRRIWDDIRRGKPGLWLGWLARGFGRFVFRVAGLGLDRPALAASPEPTEIALGGELDMLYAALPAALKHRFADLPGLVDRLQADVQALRGRTDVGVHGRAATAVAALETLRLDLLKLQGGGAMPEELTRDLEAARLLGERVDSVNRLRES